MDSRSDETQELSQSGGLESRARAAANPAPLDDRLAVCVLFAGMLVVYFRFFVGYTPAGDDIVYQYVPYQELVRQAIHHGEWPMWNPMTFLGRPLMADIQVGVLYPPNWLHWVLPLPLSFTLLFLAHTAWMLWGCYRLGRAWALSRPAAVLLAHLFTFSAFFTVKLSTGIILFHATASWLPWSALALTVLARNPGLRPTAVMALTLAMSILAGSPQITFYSWLMIAGLAVILPLRSNGEAPSRRRLQFWGFAAAAFLLAILLTLFQTFQTYHMAAVSFDRGAGASWEYITDGSLRPRLMGLLLNPGLFGPGHDVMQYWGSDVGFSEVCAYLPIWTWFVLVPAGAALLFSGGIRSKTSDATLHRRLILAGIGLALLALLLAPGADSPLFRLFYNVFPGFDRFRVPARLMLGFTVGISLASAVALNSWTRARRNDERTRRRRLPAIWVLLGTLAGIALVAGIYVNRGALWSSLEAPFLINPSLREAQRVRDQFGREILTYAALAGTGLLFSAGLLFVFRITSKKAAGENGENRETPSRARSLFSPERLLLLLPLLAAFELAFLAWPNQTRVKMKDFSATFYPRTDRVESLLNLSRGGRILWMHELLDWNFDQNQPELLRNALIMQGLADARGYDPINAKWIGTWMNRLAGLEVELNPQGYMFVPQIHRPAWLTLMGVETLLSYFEQTDLPGMELRDFKNFPEGPLGFWVNTGFKGLAFAAPAAEIVDDREEAQALSARRAEVPGADPFSALVYDSEIHASGLRLSSAVGPEYEVRPIEEGPNRFRYETRFPQPAALYFAQSAYPGWRVKINGEAAPLSIACGTFMAVAVDGGVNQVEFEYRPPKGYSVAVAISVAAGLMIAAALLLGFVRRGRGPAAPQS